jgi:hypothetical protein
MTLTLFEAVQYPFWAWEAGNYQLPYLLTYLTTVHQYCPRLPYLGTEYGILTGLRQLALHSA